MNRFFFVGLIIILIAGVSFIVLSFILPPNVFFIGEPENLSLLNKPQEEKLKITLFTVGDIMLDRGVELKIKKEGRGDFKFPFLRIADDLKEADILFGNLEGPISDKGKKVGSIYSFRANPEAVEGLKYAGFDVLSLANNHILDYQRVALEDTMKILKENEIDYIGAGFNEKEAFSLKIKEIKGTKIGFLAYTNLGPAAWKASEYNISSPTSSPQLISTAGMAWFAENDLEKIKKDIKEAKQKVDVLIVSLHSGEEYSPTPVPFQTVFARAVIEAGADLVIGHHPHVVQKIEKYQNGWIAYSLGNFIFDQSFSEETMEGCVLKVVIERRKIKKVISLKTEISQAFQPYFPSQYILKDFVNNEKKDLILEGADFLDVDLSEMKINFYQKGFLIKKISILVKGDPEFWGGTPLGIYQVISKYKLAFSSVAEVYMPWSVNFYGKYYIHGQSDYQDSSLSDFDYTGGCIRLTNENAKIVYDLAERGMPVLVSDDNYDGFIPETSQKMQLIPEVTSYSYLVADLDSSFVFSEKISQTTLPIASLTKLMTTLAVIEGIDLRKSILVTDQMLTPFGETQGLEAGKKYKLVELLYPDLIESSNDAAEILSYFLGKEKTIKLMEEKAKAIGMKNTKFAEPTGLSKENISTSQDLFYLGKYILKTRPPLENN